MPKRFLLCLLLALPLSALAAARVVTLAPNLTEMAFAAGITPVAVSEYSDYPPAAQSLPTVANWQGVNIEAVLAQKPDVVLAWRGGNPQRQVDQLQKLGVKVIWMQTESLAGLSQALRQLAPYSPQPKAALAAATDLSNGFQALQKQYQRPVPLPVFLQFGSQPLFTAAGNTLQNDILALCGGRNIFADSRVPWPQVSREQVLVRQPAAIVSIGDSHRASAIHAFWQPQLNVPIIMLTDDWFSRPGPRMLDAAKQLCPQLAKEE